MDPAREPNELNTPGLLADCPPARWQVVLAWAAVAVFYLVGTTHRWEPSPDSALYLGLARSLATGEGYRFNGQISTTVTPGLPWVLAGVQLAFGEQMLAANLFVVLCGLAALVMVHQTVRLLSDRRTALAVMLATAFSYPMFFNAHRVLTDVPFMLLFWAMFYVAVRCLRSAWPWGWVALAGLLSAVGVTVRAPGALLIGPLAAGLVLDRGPMARRLALGAVILLAAAATGGAFYWAARQVSTEPPPYVEGSVGSFWAANRPGQLAPGLKLIPDTVAELFTSQGGAGMIPVGVVVAILVAIGCVRLWGRGQRSIMAVLVCVPILLILLGGYQSIRSRYLIGVLPMLLYAAIEGLLWIVGRVAARRSAGAAAGPKVRLAAVNILVGLAIAVNLPKITYHSFYYQAMSHRDDFYQKIGHGEHFDLMAVAKLIGRDTSAVEPIACPADEVTVLHYVTRRRAVALPLVCPQTAADAGTAMKFLAGREDLKFVVLANSKKNASAAPFWGALREGLCAGGKAEVVYDGKTLQVIRRL